MERSNKYIGIEINFKILVCSYRWLLNGSVDIYMYMYVYTRVECIDV